ncbi:homeobox-leucine zipper family protein /lipid-binding START domain-containing protein [Striga asiatica]|uniref:Homeobox-leucine zipper family protein /lipid-binding START domain-containing protein n=1 Tax=Striga asiatica TaxID=4170 RepID=A0A5A7R9S8_STRAF|nr:homeobox-leucine zipper family protein /lipid-binding START domain-containing protein [Striga asiatica]
MALETASLPQSPVAITKDDFEWLEMAEFDTNAIHELLYEPTEETGNGGSETLMQEANTSKTGLDKGLPGESYWWQDEIKELEKFDWPSMVGRETLEQCNDMVGDWYGDSCVEGINDFFEIGDYSFSSHNANLYDEIGYIGLWQENYDL